MFCNNVKKHKKRSSFLCSSEKMSNFAPCMRVRVTIITLFLAIICVLASNILQTAAGDGDMTAAADVSSESSAEEPVSKGSDTANVKRTTLDSLKSDAQGTDTLDSLHLAIYMRNKAVDDSLAADSANRARKNGIDVPVNYTSKDSLVYFAGSKKAFLYGNANVKYDNMDLTAEHIDIKMDSSLVHATGAFDTVKKAKIGMPVFVMGSDKYETDTMAFNFKTKKGLIQNAYTEQQDGFLISERSKRDADGNFYLQHGRYTTCDDPHPDFYLSLSRAKVRPGKDVVFGPAYLVVQDIPMPLAIPYGFFPFSKSYSSGFIMPTYGDETERGFYLRDGGYYFAISDKMDLKLLGEIFTKGSWGFSAASNYNVRYKHSGSFYFSYQDSRTGEEGFPDYSKTTSYKLQWSHRQDAKSSPYSSLSASVNFSSTNYERNNLTSMYNPTMMAQTLRTSSVSWGTQFSSIGMSLHSTLNLSQNMSDSTIDVSFPGLTIDVSRFYPFKRARQIGKERWYEKISMSYSGQLTNSIHTKEDKLFSSNLVKDWKNGMLHNIPVEGNFSILKYITVTPNVRFTDRMYTNKVDRHWDEVLDREILDTIYGFYNVYDYNMSISAQTTLYGMYVPSRKIFGDRVQAIRHVVKPRVSYSYSPDFGAERYGYYKTYQRPDGNGGYTSVEYTPYSGVNSPPGKGKTGSISMSLENNLEMKIRDKNDSIKKVSLIDQLSAQMSYNMAAKVRPWSDLSVNLRLKWWKSYTFSLNARFATYAYELDDNGKPYIGNRTEYSYGRFGRFQGMSQNFSYTLNPEKIKKLFGGGDDDDKKKKDDDDDDDTGVETNVDPDMQKGKNGARKENAGMAETDEDGYMKFSMPWSLTFSYGITMRENTSGRFNKSTMRYPYRFDQTLNMSGNIRLSDGWNISFISGYDFEQKKITMTTASLARDLHCFSMSCSVVIAPYTSYNFSFRCNASTLADALKYDKRSGYSNSVKWY